MTGQFAVFKKRFKEQQTLKFEQSPTFSNSGIFVQT